MRGGIMNYRILLLALVLAGLVFGGCVGAKEANETGLKIKTIDHIQVTEEKSLKSQSDFSARKNKWDNGTVVKAIDISGKLHHDVHATTRVSGGITVELFCQDNTGRFMPVWGGSITKVDSAWDLTPAELHRDNVDGCYFGVVDSTSEMQS
jgi:hypothetical protein